MVCVTRRFVPPAWLDGTVKHCSRAYSRMAVLDAGVDEVLWVDDEDNLLEGTRSNVFAVSDGVLRTPPVDGRFLAGVTRSFVLEAAAEAEENLGKADNTPASGSSAPPPQASDEFNVRRLRKGVIRSDFIDRVRSLFTQDRQIT